MPDNRRIIFLDYLRIFAFVSVLVGHKSYVHALTYINNETLHAAPRFVLECLLPLFRGGGAGIIIFFLVSGYIITHVLQSERPTDFFIKRIFRIYPLYIVAVLLQAIDRYYSDGHIPDIGTILPQLLLVGDFFGTPYTLNGVEWTLRVEVVFYVFMGVLRYLNLIHEYPKTLPWILLVATILLGILSPIPSSDIYTKGYFTIYSPFLFLGAFCYLKEIKRVSFSLLIGFTFLVLFQYYYLISVYQPRWIGQHFAALAVVIFLLSWRYRVNFISTSGIRLFSDLTYSVYLFHNWMWNPIKKALGETSASILHPDIEALFVLLWVCFFMLKLVEKPSVKLGRVVSKYIREKYSKPNTN